MTMATASKKFDPVARRRELIRQITDNQRVATDKMPKAQSYPRIFILQTELLAITRSGL